MLCAQPTPCGSKGRVAWACAPVETKSCQTKISHADSMHRRINNR